MADKITQITYEDFERHITALKELAEIESGINSLLNKYKVARENEAKIHFPTLETNVVELLKTITNDTDEWIDYWIYELDFGDRDNGNRVTIDSKPILLKTVRELWDLLNDNPKFIDKES